MQWYDYRKKYAKLVLEYCRYINQGNKSIVKTFLEGLNKNNFTSNFKEIPIDKNDNFYLNTEKYMNSIKTMIENRKKRLMESKLLIKIKIENILILIL